LFQRRIHASRCDSHIGRYHLARCERSTKLWRFQMAVPGKYEGTHPVAPLNWTKQKYDLRVTLQYRSAIRAVEPDHLVLRPRKMRSGQRFIPLDPEAFIQTALASDRYLQKSMGLMALTGRRPAEIFFSASFSLPQKTISPPCVRCFSADGNSAGHPGVGRGVYGRTVRCGWLRRERHRFPG
jgi:hypothetical protein